MMTIFQWENSLEIGIDTIDRQHRGLIQKLDDLAQAVLKKQGKDKIRTMMRFMEEYGEQHFADEERFMIFYEYPGLEGQRKNHEKVRETTKRLMEQLESKNDMESFAASVQRYLIDWLILHIKTEDMKFGDYIKENGL
jgi:hemerythrin